MLKCNKNESQLFKLLPVVNSISVCVFISIPLEPRVCEILFLFKVHLYWQVWGTS